MRVAGSALLLFVLLATAVYAVDEGIIALDDLTFDKIVDGSRDVLVRFDKEYPWGDAHNAFKEVAKSAGPSPLLVVTVPIAVRDSYKVNEALADRFGLTAIKDLDDKFPLIRLFKKGAPVNSPLEYTGDTKKADAVLSWAVQQTGMFIGLKGQVKELDELAKRFMAAADSERKVLVSKAQQLANSITGAAPEHIEYYVKTFQRVLEKGADYVESEAARLRKMANDKGVAAAKKETFTWRANVLGSFGRTGAKSEL